MIGYDRTEHITGISQDSVLVQSST